jgi:hypothetical protein
MSALGEYLAAQARGRWSHGDVPGVPKRDCCTFLADWLIACGYPDPMAFIRDAYTTEAEADELVAKGRLLRLATRGFRSIGLAPTTEPVSGDVAILRRPSIDGGNAICAIRSGERWATLLDRGITIDQGGDLLKAWRVEWEKL